MLSRQPLPTFDRTDLGSASGVARGAYVLADAPTGEPDVLLLATGSEVPLALAAQEELAADRIAARVVSMPCWELFDRQPPSYRDEVLPPSVPARVAVEQASTSGWDRYVGDRGAVVGMHTFGASAPLKQLLSKFGFTPTHLARAARGTRWRHAGSHREGDPTSCTSTMAEPRGWTTNRCTPRNGGADCDALLAAKLRGDGAKSFVDSWNLP